MKTFISISAAFLITFGTFAQMRPLNGNGVILKKSFEYKEFDKIKFQDLAGKVSVEVGQPFKVEIEIDENLADLLEVNQNEGKLLVAFTGNRNNKLYVEKTNIRIKVSLPEISVLEHTGNTDVLVNGVIGRYFRLENAGNGDVRLNGTVDELDIVKNGNGDVKAGDLIAQTAKVRAYGNGNVNVNVKKSLKANGSGNGNIRKTGSGTIEAGSGIVGNGDILSNK